MKLHKSIKYRIIYDDLSLIEFLADLIKRRSVDLKITIRSIVAN